MSQRINLVCVNGIVGVRSQPDPQSEQLTELLFNECFLAESEHEGLVLGVTEADGIRGYAPRAAFLPKSGRPTHRVRQPIVHVYAAPDLRGPWLLMLPMNALVELTGRVSFLRSLPVNDKVRFVELHTGGWVAECCLVNAKQFETSPEVVARSFVGTPYLHGGKTRLGCDGAGLIQTVMAACGLAIPRQLSAQRKYFEDQSQRTQLPKQSTPSAALFYSSERCGFLFNTDIISANPETMQVDVTSFEEFREIERTSGSPLSIFPLPVIKWQ